MPFMERNRLTKSIMSKKTMFGKFRKNSFVKQKKAECILWVE